MCWVWSAAAAYSATWGEVLWAWPATPPASAADLESLAEETLSVVTRVWGVWGVSEVPLEGVGNEARGEEVSEMMGEEVSETMGEEVSETMGEEVSETMGEEVSETMGEEVSETMGEEVSETMEMKKKQMGVET